ncbi:MAG: HepT-like ribonuclease domain-containing protein [Pseudomonadota bacterium]
MHQYDDVDLDEVWRTVRNELPGLIAQLDPLVKRIP